MAEQAVSASQGSNFEGNQPKYIGGLISVDLQESTLEQALETVAKLGNLKIIIGKDVKGSVTLRLVDVPWDQVIDVILKTNNLDKVQEGDALKIIPAGSPEK